MQVREADKFSVYVAIPTTWEPERFFETINNVVLQKIGNAVFYETPEEADRANREAGADPNRFSVVRVTMDREPK